MGIYNSFDMKIILPLSDFIMKTSIKKKYDYLLKSQNWSFEKINKYQKSRLRSIIKYAYNNVPYYHKRWKEIKVYPDDIKTLKDLKKIPIITKDDIRNNIESFKSKDFDRYKPKINTTGGSTGVPLKYWLDWNNYSYIIATTLRGWSWADYKLGDKLVTIGGSSISSDDKKGFKSNFKNKIIFRKKGLSAFDMNPLIMNNYFNIIKKYKPKFIRGYPSSLVILSKNVPEKYFGFDNLKAAFTTSEVLYNSDRKIISNALGIEVFDGYGARDGGINAMECKEHNGLHHSIETSIAEFILDNEDVTSKETGNIIVTNLLNYSFPFIRYEVGDLGILSDEKCECGRNLPLIKGIQGRTTETIKFKDGTQWGGPVVTLVFARFDIKQYQVIQEKENLIIIKIIKGPTFNKNEENKLLKIFKSHTGKNAKIDLKYVNKIQTSKSGKRRFIISKISRDKNDY